MDPLEAALDLNLLVTKIGREKADALTFKHNETGHDSREVAGQKTLLKMRLTPTSTIYPAKPQEFNIQSLKSLVPYLPCLALHEIQSKCLHSYATSKSSFVNLIIGGFHFSTSTACK
jgi:hypothetical protein